MNFNQATEISVAILAGGQSRRMGRDKAFLSVGGRPVIERVIERVRSLSDDITIITNQPQRYRHLNYRMVEDVYPGKGALGGIYTAIHAARHPFCLVVACDMPFLNPTLLRYLMSLTSGFDAVVPYIEAHPEAMHAVYGRRCLEPIQRRLLADQLKISGFFSDVRVRYVERDHVTRYDPHFRSFLNMNTPADWEHVQRLAANE
jgi:molybdopterin-guanine dinucleotide biosynthesis protein A